VPVKRAVLAAVIALLRPLAATAAADPLAGTWTGTMTAHGAPLEVSFELESSAGGLQGRFSSDAQQVMDYPLDSVTRDASAVRLVLGGGLTFDTRLAGDKLTGTFKSEDLAGEVSLRRAAKTILPYRTSEVTFRNGDVALAGTLAMPTVPGKHAAVVLLHGSGPETRWGTNRFIADRFARAGIVTLVFDKRGSGASTGDWKTADFEALARDALAGVALLRTLPEVDARRIGLLGHSQGGIVAPLAASLAGADVAFIVAEDTVAGPVWKQDLYRVRNALADEFQRAEVERAMTVYTLFLEVALGRRPHSELEAASAPVAHEGWFEWLGIPPRDSWLWDWYAKTGPVDTLESWRKVKCPVLLVYGQRDKLVPVDESIAQIEAALDGTGASTTAWIAPRAEHNLTVTPQRGEPFFWWHAAPGIVDSVAAWILATGR
jgi:uncharacterized protein